MSVALFFFFFLLYDLMRAEHGDAEIVLTGFPYGKA